MRRSTFSVRFTGSKGDFNKEAVAAADPQVAIDVGEAKDGMKDDLDTLQDRIGIPVVHIASSLDSYDKALHDARRALARPTARRSLRITVRRHMTRQLR